MMQPCSDEEAAAAVVFAERLREQRFAVDVEEFPARPPERRLLAYGFLSAIAGLATYPAPLLSALVGIAAIVLHARESEGRPLLHRHEWRGSNVRARSPAASRPTLVVVASAVVVPARFGAGPTRALVAMLHAAMVTIAVAGAAVWVAAAGAAIPRWLAAGAAGTGVAVAALSVALYRPRRGAAATESPAAALLLDLAPAVHALPVWLLVAGTGGVSAFLDEHPETAGARWLNLEPSPDGGTYAVSEEGTWRERRADRFLLGAAEEAGAEARRYRAAPTNATVLLGRHRRALTLMVGGDGTSLVLARDIARAAAAEPAP